MSIKDVAQHVIPSLGAPSDNLDPNAKKVSTGSATASSTTITVSGLSFQPKLIVINSSLIDGSNDVWVYSSGAYTGSSLNGYFTHGATSYSSTFTVNASGFTCSAANVSNGSVYSWIAIS